MAGVVVVSQEESEPTPDNTPAEHSEVEAAQQAEIEAVADDVEEIEEAVEEVSEEVSEIAEVVEEVSGEVEQANEIALASTISVAELAVKVDELTALVASVVSAIQTPSPEAAPEAAPEDMAVTEDITAEIHAESIPEEDSGRIEPSSSQPHWIYRYPKRRA